MCLLHKRTNSLVVHSGVYESAGYRGHFVQKTPQHIISISPEPGSKSQLTNVFFPFKENIFLTVNQLLTTANKSLVLTTILHCNSKNACKLDHVLSYSLRMELTIGQTAVRQKFADVATESAVMVE